MGTHFRLFSADYQGHSGLLLTYQIIIGSSHFMYLRLIYCGVNAQARESAATYILLAIVHLGRS